jgi:transposase
MSVTADGAVPLVHKIYSGNQTDDKLHPENHQRLRKLLKRSDFIYVADCKLATDDNLAKIASCGGKFVSVMPRTWKEDEVFRNKIRVGEIKWSHLLSKKNNRKPKSKKDRYYLAEGDYKTSKGYRLIWILSKQKAEQDVETRERHIEKSFEELKELQSKLNTYSLKTRKNIKEKMLSILKANQCSNFIDFEIHSKTYHKRKYNTVGRPNPNSSSKLVPFKYFEINFEINIENIVEESKTDGVFPLITNLSKENPKKVLEIYKYQPFLEKRHSQLKTYQLTTPAFLKKSERVIAYLHMHVMALMVSTIVERQLRIAMKKKSIKSLPIYPEGRTCPYPTMYDIVRLFKGVERYEVIQGENVSIFPAQLSDLQRQVIDLLEIPKSLYQ